MVITSFDPGSNSTGWCTLESIGGAGRPISARYLAAGNVASESAAISTLLREQSPDVVAVEKLAGFAYDTKGPGVVAGLIASSRAAGIISATAAALGITVVEMTAIEWRRMVLGKGSATDQAIARVIPRLVQQWPKRSNVHMRDAAGLGLAVNWHLNGRLSRETKAG